MSPVGRVQAMTPQGFTARRRRGRRRGRRRDRFRFAEPMITNAPLAVSGAKEILEALARGEVECCRLHLEALIREALDSADYRGGAAAFLEKRPPTFAA